MACSAAFTATARPDESPTTVTARDSVAQAPAAIDTAAAIDSLPPIEASSTLDASWVGEDTVGVHAQLGVRVDATNESYYEDAFIDTTFIGRRLIGTPETRTAGVLSGAWAGTRHARAQQYRAQTDLSIGDRLEREYAGLSWRAVGTAWTWLLDPSAEHRRDRTFDRDLEEWRAAMGARAKHPLADELTTLELGLRADLLRTSGSGSEFLPDRQGVTVSSALDHLGLLGDEWRIGYQLAARQFPDSSARDHFEHLWEARWKAIGAGKWLALEGTATRRVTVHVVPTSRDNFWIGDGSVEGRIDLDGGFGLGARGELEATHYDLEDSTLYFDYQVARSSLLLRWERGTRWALELGPRAEELFSRLEPGEEYRELSGVFDLEYLANASWWNLTPAIGWRAYQDVSSAGPGTPPLHSSYAFYALDLIGDQPLPAGLRFKAIASLRWEYHVDSAQDARSVYASAELTRALR
jgi:hypothetical protein